MMTNLLRYTAILAILITGYPSSYGQVMLEERISISDFYKGLELYDQQQYEAAQHYLDKYIVKHTVNEYAIEAAYYAAFCAVKLDRIDSKARLQQFVEKYSYHPKAALVYYELGNIYCTQQDYAKGIHYYLLIDKSQLTNTLQTELQYKLAYAYLNEKEFDQALNYFNYIKKHDTPYTPASNYYAGYLALKKGDYNNALADLRKAGENEAYKPVVPYMIMEVFYQAKRFQAATNYAKELQAKQPVLKNHEDIELLTAESYFFLKDYASAIRHYENYFYLQPSEVTHILSYRLAYALYKSGENYKSLKYLKELALQDDHWGQLASYYMGLIYIKTSQKNLALAAFDQARQLGFVNEIQIEASFQYAQLSYELGKLTMAIDALQKFKKTYPNSQHIATVDHLLSQVYFHTNHYDLAIAHIEGLQEKTKDILQVYQKATFYKGGAYFNQEVYDKAITWLQKSLQYPLDTDITLQAYLWMAESYAAQQACEQAITHYQTVLAATDKKDALYYQDALYGLAYVYFNTEKYNVALPLFLQYNNMLSTANNSNWRSDALVRTADCYYAIKSYNKALDLYTKTESTYPAHNLYQKALIYELLGRFTEAKRDLESVINTYSHTAYYEKALFEYAYLALQHQDYQLAVKGFTDFIEIKPYSTLVPDALLHRAVAKVNLKQYAEAGKDYEILLTDYPTHPNAQSALLELPNLVIQEGKPEKLQQYLANYKAANPGSETLASISFEAAKNLYYSQNYTQAIQQLTEFITNYPNSKLVDEANFLIAEAYYRLADDEQALTQYHIANQNKQTPFHNRILLRVASLAYKHKDYNTALAHYNQLKESASNKKETYYALEGLMKTNDALQHYEEVNKAASQIINQGNVTLNATNQAALYLGKTAMKQNKYEQAREQFKKIVESGKDIYGAESQYLIAYMEYQTGKFKESLEALFLLTKQFSEYTDWINQGFLLMADNYIALHEFFQAKATLQSIIENAADKSLVGIAQEKLQLLIQQIEADSLAQASTITAQPLQDEDSEFKTLE
jgi:tetratricopeptide (TPR) repeat protein